MNGPQSVRTKKGAQNYAYGLWAEKFAELILRIKGYQILGRRIKTPSGEIDILAATKKTLVVVEVKKRGDDFSAASAIRPAQQARLIASGSYMMGQVQGYETVRFDALLFAPKTLPKHIKNAFFAP